MEEAQAYQNTLIQELRSQLIDEQEKSSSLKASLQEFSQENEDFKNQIISLKEKTKLLYEENKTFVKELEGFKMEKYQNEESNGQYVR